MAKHNHIENYLPQDIKYKTIFKKLKKYALDHLFIETKVGEKYQDVSDIEFNIIRLKKRDDEEKMLFYFLHELGHVRVCLRRDYETKFNNMICALDTRRYNTNAYRIGRLQEEILAWDEAFELAKELRLKIDYERMECEKNK